MQLVEVVGLQWLLCSYGLRQYPKMQQITCYPLEVNHRGHFGLSFSPLKRLSSRALHLIFSLEGHLRGRIISFSPLEKHLRGHFISFSPLEGHLRGHFILFSPLEGHLKGHFISFSPPEGHLRGHFISFSPLEEHLRGHIISFLTGRAS